MSESSAAGYGPQTDARARTDRDKALLRTVIEQDWTTAWGLEELARHVAPGYVHHAPFGDLTFEQFRAGVAALQAMSPTLRYAVTHVIAEGNLYAVHLRSILTHTGETDGLPATGKVVECAGAYHCRMVDGKIAEDWDVWTIQPVFAQLMARLRA